MTRPEICEICEEKQAYNECPLCNRLVCRGCILGDICVICTELLCTNCKKRLSDRACNICGL